jgi:uncharacterized membrane protein
MLVGVRDKIQELLRAWLAILLLSFGLTVGTFVLWVLLMWRAYQGKEWDVPFAGGLARKLMG